MPKVFRPSLKQVKSQTKVDRVHEETTIRLHHRSPSPVKQTIQQSVPAVSNVLPHPRSPTFTKMVKGDLSNDAADLDMDRGSLLLPLEDKSREVNEIQLFVTKKTRRVATKPTENSPPTNEPLDRSSVTLRSLLSWVPANKPPPSYRQERLNSPSTNNDLDMRQNSSPKTIDDVIDNNYDSKVVNEKSSLVNDCVDPLAPQLRIDSDGNIVLDEASLLVGRPESLDVAMLKHVTEEAGILNVNYNSFRLQKLCRGPSWSTRETTRFYRALNTIGTDFYVMEKMFPKRSRTELKRKFKREEKLNPYLVNQALRYRRNYDLSAFLSSSDDEEQKPILKSKRKYTKRKDKKVNSKDNVSETKVSGSHSQLNDSLIESINEVFADESSLANDEDNINKHLSKAPILQKMIADKQIELNANEQSDFDTTDCSLYDNYNLPNNRTEFELLRLRQDFLGEKD